jgi:EAL domain-containing protein (putative c-di-GMP-specific phosphodiesterase class I)
MSLNASPATVASPAFERALADVAPGRVLVEVTEHLVAEQPDVLAGAMERLRALGVRFAVDDAGAGYSGLNQMVRLAPDVIKLDRFLITGIDRDPARQALAFAAASFAARTRTRLIAEGIETATELATLRALGVGYGQGFHLGRPDALERAVKLRPPPL